MNFLIAILGIFLVACTRQTANLHPLTLLSPTNQRIALQIEVADTPDERSRGLMFREQLPERQGIFFIFEKPQVLNFWMKNTRIPLDILFFDGAGKLISTTTMEPCEKDPCQTYSSMEEAQYALEIPAGFVEQYGIVEGWKIPVPSLQ